MKYTIRELNSNEYKILEDFYMKQYSFQRVWIRHREIL